MFSNKKVYFTDTISGGDSMKKYNLMGIAIGNRREFAPQVQEILTEFGCIIKMRIGLHEEIENSCSNEGFIILNLSDDDKEINRFVKKLESIDTVRVKNIKV